MVASSPPSPPKVVIYSLFNTEFLSTYDVRGTVLGAGNSTEQDKYDSFPKELTFYWEEYHKQIDLRINKIITGSGK